MFKYDPYKYTKVYTYGYNKFQFDPTVAVPVPKGHEDFGKTLKQIYNMPDKEAYDLVIQEKWAQVRKYRDEALAACDWVSGEDIPQSIKDVYFPYRQALRDITSGNDPDNLIWPEKP